MQITLLTLFGILFPSGFSCEPKITGSRVNIVGNADFSLQIQPMYFLFSICTCILLAIIIYKLTEQEITVDLSIRNNPDHMVINGKCFKWPWF